MTKQELLSELNDMTKGLDHKEAVLDRWATEQVKKHLNKAAENVFVDWFVQEIHKESITGIEINID